MNWKPNKWIAVVLSLILSPLGLVYVGRIRLACVFFLASAALGVVIFLGIFLQELEIIGMLLTVLLPIFCAFVTYKIAVVFPEKSTRHWLTKWYGLTLVFGSFVSVAFIVRVFFYEPFRLPSVSMAPTGMLHANVIVKKWGYGHFSTFGFNFGSKPHSDLTARGDIIVFDYPPKKSLTYIARVVGIPGDQIEVDQHRLTVNGVRVTGEKLDDFLIPSDGIYVSRYSERIGSNDYGVLINDDKRDIRPYDFELKNLCTNVGSKVSCKVPEGRFYVLGDNRSNSEDSRFWGFVKAEEVIGKVVFISK